MTKQTVDPSLLYAALDAARQERGNSSWRTLAKEIGVSPSLLSRIANGQKPDADGFTTLVTWLNMPAETFVRGVGEPTEPPALMAELAILLRARTDLTQQDAEYLETIFAAALRQTRASG